MRSAQARPLMPAPTMATRLRLGGTLKLGGSRFRAWSMAPAPGGTGRCCRRRPPRAHALAGLRAEGRHDAREGDGVEVGLVGRLEGPPLNLGDEVLHVQPEGARGRAEGRLILQAVLDASSREVHFGTHDKDHHGDAEITAAFTEKSTEEKEAIESPLFLRASHISWSSKPPRRHGGICGEGRRGPVGSCFSLFALSVFFSPRPPCLRGGSFRC